MVPYNDTELVLSCRTEWANLTEGFVPPGPLWRKDDCISGQILSQGHNYTMNDLGRRLTNDDSATYCYIDSVPSRTEYHYVHVNVHGEYSAQFIDILCTHSQRPQWVTLRTAWQHCMGTLSASQYGLCVGGGYSAVLYEITRLVPSIQSRETRYILKTTNPSKWNP